MVALFTFLSAIWRFILIRTYKSNPLFAQMRKYKKKRENKVKLYLREKGDIKRKLAPRNFYT